MGKVPACVGVPDRTPAADSDRPLGSALAVVKLVVPTPPDCVKVALKGEFAVPVLLAGALTVMAWQLMTRVYVAPAPMQLLASVALTVIGNVPVCVGVPESVPLAASVRPV